MGPSWSAPARVPGRSPSSWPGVSAGTVIGLPAGQALGNLLGWRLTFAAAAAAGLVIAAAQMVLLPGVTADGHTRLRDLGGVFRIPSARAGLIATAIVFTGQFAASTYITPLLTEHARMSAPQVTALFFGYGTAGIIGTLIGGRSSPAAQSAPSPALPWQSARP